MGVFSSVRKALARGGDAELGEHKRDEPQELAEATPEIPRAEAPNSIARLTSDLERAEEAWRGQVQRRAEQERRLLRFRRAGGEDRQAVAQRQALSRYEEAWERLERARAETQANPDETATETGPIEPEPAAVASRDPESNAGNDELEERVRVAVERVEQHSVEEIEALEGDLERATEKADNLQAELERTKTSLNEALANSARAERELEAEVKRRVAAETEAKNLRGELKRLRSDAVAGDAPVNLADSPDDDADQPRRTGRLGLPLGVVVGAVALVAGGAGLVSGVTTADSEGPAVETAGQNQTQLAYQRTLRREVGALGASRTSHLERFREADTAADQAAAAEHLATAHARAAKALDRAPAPAALAPENDSVVSALRQTADAYRQLAAGAATRRPAAYEAGATAVRRAEAKLQRRLRASSRHPL